MKIEELASRIAEAAAHDEKLEILGSGALRKIGKPVVAQGQISLATLSGIEAYEPEELVLTALAGTARADVEAELAAKGQMFAFEPPDLSHFTGAQTSGTLGGLAASNLSGPRRMKAGAARDHLLGFTAVSGRGEIFKAGGKVVKNVTGYDLPKLMAGSWGTLGVMHSLTFKVLPAPETEISMVLEGPRPEQAVRAMAAGMNCSAEVSGAAYLPETKRCWFRLEGVKASLNARQEVLEKALRDYGELHRITASPSRNQWAAIRDGKALGARAEDAVWRISVAPSDGAKVLSGVLGARGFLDWAGGLVWLAVPGEFDANVNQVMAVVKVLGGHASLIRASENVRQRIACRSPEEPAIAAISNRVRKAFDPKGILNPGRMG